MISIIKIIGTGFGLLMAYSTFLSYKKKELSRIQFLFWEAVWVFLLLMVFFTDTATGAVKAIGFIRVMDFLTVGGFIIITVLSFYNYSELIKTRKKLEQITREESLKDIK